MNSEKWQKLNELFDEGSQLTATERDDFVAAVADDEIRAELKSLLDSHSFSEKFLNRNAVELSARSLLVDDGASAGESMVGKQIGQFRIVSEIGRGGMGAVYLAERADGEFTQRAALKLIKRGMDTDFIIQRFQNERQILSRLNHPYIAKLLDGGTTTDGLPFFVMEYIEGENLKESCAAKKPSLEKKLELFRQVCEAVAFAHRSLIVHRDLKPSNIIVTEDGKPKLLDFGIAKLLDSDGEDRTTTEFRLLTPKYASPEQARGELVSTQSDVYSLGVILREIVTDDETQTVGGDLKTIIDKATHDEPARRYISVEQFSEDIRRYQNDLPVLARPDSVSYRGRKFVARHRFGVAAGALLILAVLIGAGATLWQFRRAQAESVLAEKRFNDVRGLANSVIFDLHDEIQNLPGSTKARKLLIEKALEYLNKLEQDAGNDPGLQHELAMAYLKIADVQGQVFEASLLETDEAVANYRKAMELEEKAVNAEPRNFEFRRDLGLICYRFAEALRGSNDLTEVLTLEKRAVDTYEPLARERWDDVDIRRRWLVARSGVADVMRESGQLDDALKIYEQNIVDVERAVADAPTDLKLNNFYAVAYGNYANALFVNGEPQKAISMTSMRSPLQRTAPADDGSDVNSFRNSGVHAEDLCRFSTATGDFAGAEEYAKRDVYVMEKIAREDPENMEAKYDVASSHNTYADLLEKSGRVREALGHRRIVIEAIAPLEKKENNPELYTADFFEFYSKFAATAARSGLREEAQKYIAKAEALDFDITKTSAETQNLYSRDFVALANAYIDLGDHEKARSWYLKAIETWNSLKAADKFYPSNAKNLAEAEQALKTL